LIGYPLDRLHEEMAFLAYHFHWDRETLLNLEHQERRRWCEEVSKINKKMSGARERTVSLEDIT